MTGNQTNILAVNYVNLQPKGVPLTLSNGSVNLTFTNAPVGQRYAMERSTNLIDWASLLTNQVPADGVLRFTNSTILPKAFYRARLVP